jgi:hypothetical protein
MGHCYFSVVKDPIHLQRQTPGLPAAAGLQGMLLGQPRIDSQSAASSSNAGVGRQKGAKSKKGKKGKKNK